MIKELKYLFYIIVIFFFTFFTSRYYFSDENEKKNYRSINILEDKIKKAENSLITLKSNTENIIEIVEIDSNKKTKKYSFWKLLYND
tara:strand:+ start:414 stop:674 length:261 start_codon:yes stop_codon:yes gene_type:complete